MLQVGEVREGHRITKKEVKAVQAEECKQHGGKTSKGSLAAKLQSAADRNAKNAVTSDPLLTALYDADTSKTLTKRDASKIASRIASNNKGVTPKGSFAALVQSAADKAEFYKEHEDPISASLDSTGPKPITKERASSIQSEEARSQDGKIAKGSFAALVQSAADKKEMNDRNADIQQQFIRSRHPITKEKEAKIQSKSAKKRGKGTKKGSFAAWAQSEADKGLDAITRRPDSPTAINSEITARPELEKSSRESYPTY